MNISLRTKPLRVPPVAILVTRYLLHCILLLWLSLVLYQATSGQLPGDPVQYLLDFTGISTLNLLLLCLTISPLAQVLKFGQLIVLRKTFGVYSAVYALAHFSVFIVFELQFEWALIVSEIIDRPYITVGFSALLILLILLLTSFEKLKRKMGKTWFRLHKWVYVALVLGLLHYIWSIKGYELQPVLYVLIGALLLLFRKNKLKNFFK